MSLFLDIHLEQFERNNHDWYLLDREVLAQNRNAIYPKHIWWNVKFSCVLSLLKYGSY